MVDDELLLLFVATSTMRINENSSRFISNSHKAEFQLVFLGRNPRREPSFGNNKIARDHDRYCHACLAISESILVPPVT